MQVDPNRRLDRRRIWLERQFGKILVSYNIQYGYSLDMTSKISLVQLRPAPTRHIQRAVHPRRLVRVRPLPMVKRGAWPTEVKAAFLAALPVHEDAAAAARAVGRTASAAFSERGRDPEFARAWDDLLDPRLQKLETLLLDRTISRLDPGFVVEGLSESVLRHDATIGMWFLEARMPLRYGKMRSALSIPAGGAAPKMAVDPVAESMRVAGLIEAAAKRIAEAEACLRGETED